MSLPKEFPCPTCELKSSCARAGRCCRPRSLEFWIQEVREAAKAVNAAVVRLNLALTGLNKARQTQQDKSP
jgi:hypothetical protein